MADQPSRDDERIEAEFRAVIDDNVLRGNPNGDDRCDKCRYYLNRSEDLSYCWNPNLQILVGADWWCRWFEPPG